MKSRHKKSSTKRIPEKVNPSLIPLTGGPIISKLSPDGETPLVTLQHMHKEKTADRPHKLTLVLAIASLAISLGIVSFSFFGTYLGWFNFIATMAVSLFNLSK